MLKVLRANGLGLVSDFGRFGQQHQGVPVGGVLDPVSFQVGNWALGNRNEDACLELMGQFDLLCSLPCKLLLASRAARFLVNGQQGAPGRVYALREGDLLKILGNSSGGWNIVCVAGGVDVPLVLGSRSTCLPARFGGQHGRALHVGDVLKAGAHSGVAMASKHTLAMPLPKQDAQRGFVLPCLPGPDWDCLGEQVQAAFLQASYTIRSDSGRMGYRLASAGVGMKPRLFQLKSHAVVPGLVQLPPDGQPIVLMSEAQVTGGYPRLAVVPQCALWALAHCFVGQVLRFEMLNWQTWGQLHARHQRMMNAYQHVIECHLDQC
ncbi:MAG TPA: biotin-dependent carboxyltransferase family protein [Limnobacter sp.]|nr:biotin-dependent carboxyltransferase family protein [Limnobacter sp.]